MSKIDDYGFGDKVLELRGKGKSYRLIADELNIYVPLEDEPISEMAISRWLRANEKKNANNLPMVTEESNISTESRNGVDKAEDVNPYDEVIKLVNDCDLQIEMLKRRIEPIRRNRNKILDKYDLDNLEKLHKFIGQKQSLLNDVAKHQKEMTSFTEVKEMMKIVYECMMIAAPEAYELFKQKVAERQNMRTIMKPIMNTK